MRHGSDQSPLITCYLALTLELAAHTLLGRHMQRQGEHRLSAFGGSQTRVSVCRAEMRCLAQQGLSDDSQACQLKELPRRLVAWARSEP